MAQATAVRITAITTTQIPALIQIERRTHHQDHEMYPNSLSAMKRMVRRPAKPMPEELLLEVLF